MAHSDSKNKPTVGFLTVVRDPQHGLFGGYLILNTLGRPLEFHCTAPIKPNRAQEILYGPTLEDFLYGEQIGQTLIRQGGQKPTLVCTDQEPVLAVRDLVDLPVMLVLPPDVSSEAFDGAEPSNKKFRIDAAHRKQPRLKTFDLGKNHLAVPGDDDDERTLVADRLAPWAESLDLTEPFGRIREAIAEAQSAAR